MRLIDADNLAELCDIMADKCESPTIWNQFRATVECSPTIDPVRHGRWLYKPNMYDDSTYECSECGEPWTLIEGTPWENNMHYCPNCGAKMDLEGKT